MKITEKLAIKITEKKIRRCYGILYDKYSPWCITFEIANSTQDGNYGIKYNVIPHPEEGKIIPFAGYGRTLYEALEMLEDTIKRDIKEYEYNS